jgi:hypothetical protein
MEYIAIVESYQRRLFELLASPRLKYSSWPPSEITSVRQSAGVYHFFEIHDDRTTSLYIGKGGFGSREEWNLYKRMKQHFQPSQKYALLGKASKAKEVSPEDAKRSFNESNVYLQWLVFGTTSEVQGIDIESELRGFEHFAIAILKPIYTDA